MERTSASLTALAALSSVACSVAGPIFTDWHPDNAKTDSKAATNRSFIDITAPRHYSRGFHAPSAAHMENCDAQQHVFTVGCHCPHDDLGRFFRGRWGRHQRAGSEKLTAPR